LTALSKPNDQNEPVSIFDQKDELKPKTKTATIQNRRTFL